MKEANANANAIAMAISAADSAGVVSGFVQGLEAVVEIMARQVVEWRKQEPALRAMIGWRYWLVAPRLTSKRRLELRDLLVSAATLEAIVAELRNKAAAQVSERSERSERARRLGAALLEPQKRPGSWLNWPWPRLLGGAPSPKAGGQ